MPETPQRRPLSEFIQATLDTFILASSSRRFLFGIILTTIAWISYNYLSKHPFDDWKAGFPTLVFLYTIWFGLVEGAMKIVQAEQRAQDTQTANKLYDMALDTSRILNGQQSQMQLIGELLHKVNVQVENFNKVGTGVTELLKQREPMFDRLNAIMETLQQQQIDTLKIAQTSADAIHRLIDRIEVKRANRRRNS